MAAASGPWRTTSRPAPGAAGWVHAATSSGVFRSEDAGLHWTAANKGLPAANGRVDAVFVATEPTEPAAVWVALPGLQALYRSANRGARWQYAGRGLEGLMRDVAAPSAKACPLWTFATCG